MILTGACTVILFVHAPASVVDPLTTALSQIRNGNVSTVNASPETGSITDSVAGAVKKLLK